MFEEKQQYSKVWLLLIMLPLTGLFIFGAIRYFGLDSSFGENALKDITILGAGVLLFFFIFIFLKIELRTIVDSNGVHFQFYPFHKRMRMIEWKNISQAQVIKYNPIKQYGGWGLRSSKQGRAFNIAGNHGLQLHLKNNKKLLIGTQQPDKLTAALKSIMPLPLNQRA